MIEVPAKVWRPNVICQYTIPKYEGEDLNGILDCQQYGCCVYRNKLAWSDDSGRTDIFFDKNKRYKELNKNLKFDKNR